MSVLGGCSMKKKIITLFAVAAIGAAVAVGCGNASAEVPTDSAAASITVAEESLPALDADLQTLYADAYKIYNQISFGIFDYDEAETMEKDGFTYYKVTDSRFQSYDAFHSFLEQYFTEKFVDEGILSEDNIMFAKGEDGGLYFLGSGRTANPLYAGHTFAEPMVYEDEVHFNATAYYVNSGKPYEGDPFYSAPENAGDFTAQEFDFHILKEDGVWKFDNFSLFF